MKTLTLMALMATMGCTDKDADDSAPADDSGDTAPTATMGLPEGESTWEGSAIVNSVEFPVAVTLTNTAGRLAAEVLIRDSESTPTGLPDHTFEATGTHNPVSGAVAFSPGDWISPTTGLIELMSLFGSYDPATGRIEGEALDWATGDDNVLRGGPLTLTLISGDGAATAAGDGALALPEGSLVFEGTNQCTGPVREARLELDQDGDGVVSGRLSYGDTTFAEGTNTFEVRGVHNPTTGGITLVPGLYTEVGGNSYLTFTVDGDFDPATGRFLGVGSTNVARCTAGNFDVSL